MAFAQRSAVLFLCVVAVGVFSTTDALCGRRCYPFQIDKPQYIADAIDGGPDYTQTARAFIGVQAEGERSGLFSRSYKPTNRPTQYKIIDGDVERFFGVLVTYENGDFVLRAAKLRDLQKFNRRSFLLRGEVTVVFGAGPSVRFRMSKKHLVGKGNAFSRQVLVAEHGRVTKKMMKLYVDGFGMSVLTVNPGHTIGSVAASSQDYPFGTLFPRGLPETDNDIIETDGSGDQIDGVGDEALLLTPPSKQPHATIRKATYLHRRADPYPARGLPPPPVAVPQGLTADAEVKAATFTTFQQKAS